MNNKTICALFLLLAVASTNTLENMESLDDDDNVIFHRIILPSVNATFNATVDCIRSVPKIIPALNTLIKDVKDAKARRSNLKLHLETMKDVQTLINDLQVIWRK